MVSPPPTTGNAPAMVAGTTSGCTRYAPKTAAPRCGCSPMAQRPDLARELTRTASPLHAVRRNLVADQAAALLRGG
jgi:hypothetical protein